MPPTPDDILTFADRAGFRRWLEAHHATARACRVVVKKGRPTDEPRLYYLDAVEEALCFGWIDSTNRTVDGQTVQRFSPRGARSPWSELNLARCRRLERLELMTEAGRAALPPDGGTGALRVDEEIAQAFSRNPQAAAAFRQMPPLYRRVRIDTIQRDKHKNRATFLARLERLINYCEQGKLLGQWDDYGRLADDTVRFGDE